MFPFWVEIPLDHLLQLGVVGIAALTAVMQAVLMPRG